MWTDADVADLATYIGGELTMAAAGRGHRHPEAVACSLLRMLAESGRLRCRHDHIAGHLCAVCAETYIEGAHWNG